MIQGVREGGDRGFGVDDRDGWQHAIYGQVLALALASPPLSKVAGCTLPTPTRGAGESLTDVAS